MIYFIQSEDGPIKIGWSSNPEARLKQFQPGSPFGLLLVGLEPGTHKKESELHRWFAHLRVRVGSEWFWPGEDLLDYLRSLMDPKWPKERRQPEEWLREYDD